MARLPTVGGDDNTWGDILNTFLGVEHNADGSQKPLAASKISGTAEVQTNKGQPSGYAPLDSSGKVPSANLPNSSSTDSNAVHKGDLFINVKDYGAVGDGTTDDHNAIQAALDLADSSGRAVYFPVPANRYLTSTLNYRNQPIFGDGSQGTWIQGKPGQDIFHADSSALGAFSRPYGGFRDLTFVVDDSVDAHASFPNRGGVGNAALAYDRPDQAVRSNILLESGSIKDVVVQSVSGIVNGQNNSVGFYFQVGPNVSWFDDILFKRLVYGWYGDFPPANTGVSVIANDDINVGAMYADGVLNPFRFVNWGQSNVQHLGMATSSGGNPADNATGLKIIQAPSSNERGNIDFGTVWIELNDATNGVPWDFSGASGCTFQQLSGAGPVAVNELAGDRLDIGELHMGNTAILRLTGSQIKVRKLRLSGNQSAGDAYLRDLVDDRGIGNSVELVDTFSNPSQIHRPQELTRDGRVLHRRDTHALGLGYTTPYVSGLDFLIAPQDMQPNGLGTNFILVADPTTEFGYTIRSVGANTAGAFTLQKSHLNNGAFVIGDYLPAGQIRVYVKAKAATAGTQVWKVQNNAVNLTIDTFSLTTSYQVFSTDVDLTGQTENGTLALLANAISSNSNVDVAWIMFRPYAANMLNAGYLEGVEISDPSLPAPNHGRLYFRDNGSGKTQLVVVFPSGAVQVIATQP